MDMEKVLFRSETDTLEWFDQFLDHTNGSFQTSVKLFRDYYHKCVTDLVHLSFDPEKQRISHSDLGEDKESSPDYECTYINQQDIDNCRNNHYHTNVISILRENEYLRRAVLENQLLTEEELSIIMNLSNERAHSITTEELFLLMKDPSFRELSDEERKDRLEHTKLEKDQENEIILPFLKIHRLNNLQIKYAHTARVVYLTNYELDSLGVQSPFIRSIALTSSLFHDVGRFYQGAFYNNFLDNAMKDIEGEKGHAEAGYYYSLLDMISLNTFGVNQSEDLMIHAIAALIVNNHQKSNDANVEFDHAEKGLSFPEGIDGQLFNFIIDAYLQAKPFENGVHARFGNSIPHQQKYMKEALDSIIKVTRNVLQQYTSDPEEIDKITSNIGSFLESGLVSVFFLTKDEEEMVKGNSLPDNIKITYYKDQNGEEKIVRTPELNDWLNIQKRRLFCHSNHLDYEHFDGLLSRAQLELAKFAQFDIVASITKMFQDGKVSSDVRKLIDFCLNVVMDADKIDILIQRVNKRWSNWNPQRIHMYSAPGESFLQVIENEFKIPLERNSEGEIIFNDQLKRIIIENMRGNVTFERKVTAIADLRKDTLSPDELKQLMKFLNGDYYQLMITNKFGTNESGRPIFTRALIDKILEQKKKNPKFREAMDSYPIDVNKDSVGMVIPDDLFIILQEHHIELQNLENNYVTVTYDEMRYVYPDDYLRTQIEMGIILPEDLREKVFLLDKDRGEGKKFPNNRHASSNPHFHWGNIFATIWWHIDQFIMTNMRSMKSFQFLKDSSMLDRLRETYQSDECLPEFSEFIDEIIEYGKLFIEVALETRAKNDELQFQGDGDTIDLTDASIMIQIRDEASRRWNERKKKKEMEEFFTEEKVDIPDSEKTI